MPFWRLHPVLYVWQDLPTLSGIQTEHSQYCVWELGELFGLLSFGVSHPPVSWFHPTHPQISIQTKVWGDPSADLQNWSLPHLQCSVSQFLVSLSSINPETPIIARRYSTGYMTTGSMVWSHSILSGSNTVAQLGDTSLETTPVKMRYHPPGYSLYPGSRQPGVLSLTKTSGSGKWGLGVGAALYSQWPTWRKSCLQLRALNI